MVCFSSSSDSSPIDATVLFFCWLGSSCFDFYGNKYILPWNCCSVVFRLVTPFLFLPLIRERDTNVKCHRGREAMICSHSRWWIAFSRLEGFWCGPVICDLWLLLLWRPKKKNVASFTFAIDVIYFRIHAKVNDDADLLIILKMFRSHSLWWLYRDISIFLTRSVTRCWIISEMYLLFGHGDILKHKSAR